MKAAKAKPACTCVFCAQQIVTGVFYCAAGREYVALSGGKHIAASESYPQVLQSLNNYHYDLLTHGID